MHCYDGPRENGWFLKPDGGSAWYLDFAAMSLQSSVDLFFMISGFLILPAIIRAGSVAKFAANRFVRIYPVFFLSTVPVLLLGGLGGYRYLAGLDIVHWSLYALANLLMLPGVFRIHAANRVAWTLSYELAFYIIVAVIFGLAKFCNRRLLSTIGICLVVPLLYRHPSTIAFLAGALVWKLDDRFRDIAQGPGAWLLLPLIVAFFVLTEAARRIHPIDGWVYAGYFGAFVIGVPLFYLLTNSLNSSTSILRNRIARYLGLISYSLYLWHLIVMFFAKKIALQLPAETLPIWRVALSSLLAIPLSVAVAHVSYKLIECRLADWMRRTFFGKPLETSAGTSRVVV